VAIGGYFKLNYHRLLMAIGGTILLMVIILMTIGGNFRLNYHKLLMAIGGAILLMAIGRYYIR